MRPGCYQVEPRLEDMDANHVEASLCFPTFPRFCGQTFTEAKDKELGPLCVKAYNDWMVEEWCGPEAAAGSSRSTLIPLWDAAARRRRGPAQRRPRGPGGLLQRDPATSGLPSVHTDATGTRFFAACAETGTVVNMHIGSSSKMPSTSADAPPAVGVHPHPHQRRLVDGRLPLVAACWSASPSLKLAYAEGQIGWIPYILERADKVWEENRGWGGVADIRSPSPPSTYFHRPVYGCFFDDAHGLRSVDEIGEDNITYESDYPHSDSTWPHTKADRRRRRRRGCPTRAVHGSSAATPSISSVSTTSAEAQPPASSSRSSRLSTLP